MREQTFPIPNACEVALKAIETDPLNLSPEVLAHVRACPACAEARVHWLAQDEAPYALTPAGYFDHLPERILRKLPAKRRSPFTPKSVLWASAAGILLAAGLGGFLAGRANRAPVVEAENHSQPVIDMREVMPDTPFQESEDPVSQLTAMSPEEAEAVLARLEARATTKP